MTATTTETEALPDVDEVEALAAELLRALTPHAGNPAAVSRVLNTYLDMLAPDVLAYAALKAVHLTFAECLTPTRREDWPAEGLALIAPEGDA